MKQKIFVVVNRGVAEVVEETVPQGYQVEIVDLDAVREGDAFPSPEAEALVRAAGLVR